MLFCCVDIDEFQIKIFINEDIGCFHIAVSDFQITHAIKGVFEFAGDSF